MSRHVRKLLEDYANIREISKEELGEIRDAEVSPILAYMRGREDGFRTLAINILRELKEANGKD